MTTIAYRLTYPLVAVILEDTSHLRELPAGAMFYCTNPKPDARGMVKGMYRGQMALLFGCDLEERAEPLAEVDSDGKQRN